MIRYIKGIFHPAADGTVIVENASGVGFEINIPAGSRLYKMPEGSEIKVFTSMQVREDDISLYGFAEREELELFELLLKVSGIGAKGAMSIMSAFSVEELKFAIASGDTKTISRANGIGKKTAERLVLELKDKVSAVDMTTGEVMTFDEGPVGGMREEAVSALMALGYNRNEATAAVARVKGEDLAVEDYIKQALKRL